MLFPKLFAFQFSLADILENLHIAILIFKV